MEAKEKKIERKVENYRRNSKKGITLIALVVTIIVLIILAGVSISLVLGQNGLISKAKIAKEETRAGKVDEQIQLWKMDWKIYNSTENSQKPLEEEEFLENLKADKLVNENEINEEQKTITIANKEISYKLDLQASEEIINAELVANIVTADTTSSKIKVQIEKPENLKEDTEFTYIIKKIDLDKTETIVQTKTVKESSYEFTSLEAATDYLIEVSTQNINGTIYKGTCTGNTYYGLLINLPNRIARLSDQIAALKNMNFYFSGGPGLTISARINGKIEILEEINTELASSDKYGVVWRTVLLRPPSGYDKYNSGNCCIEEIMVTDVTRGNNIEKSKFLLPSYWSKMS